MQIEFAEWAIRSFRPDDAPALAKYANNRNVWRNLREGFPHPYTRQHAEEWIRHAKAQSPETSFAIASSEELIGAIGLDMHEESGRWIGEVGYWLGEPFWGRGIATLALRALTEYAFVELDLARIQACVYEWNPASGRVLEKAGYEFQVRLCQNVTKDGQTIDELIYAIDRE